MNTQAFKTKRNRAIRQSTINKLCIALTEMSEKLPSDKPMRNFQQTFTAYCKRYNTNKNLWYSMKELGYIAKSDKKGWVFKVKRHEINKTMASLIIETYNKKSQEYKDLRKEMRKEPIELFPNNEANKANIEEKKESYLIISKDFYEKLLAQDEKYVVHSLDEIKNHKKEGDYFVLKAVGKLKVVPTAYLEMD